MKGLVIVAAALFLSSISSSSSSSLAAAAVTDTISVNQTILDGETIVSASGNYVLGFFRPSNASTRRYLGIWYKFSKQTVVWVANRETALNDASGILQVTSQGVLVIRNKDNNNHTVWSSSSSRQAQNPVAQLLDTGNLVVREANDSSEGNYLWQSFDHMGNMFLAGSKLGKNLVTGAENSLMSWKSPDDPSPGGAIYRLDTSGYPQVFVKVDGFSVFRSGPWNGLSFTGLDNVRPNSIYSYRCYYGSDAIYCEYELIDKSDFSMMVLTYQGVVQEVYWNDSTSTWNTIAILKTDKCDSYALCGPFGVCDIENSTMCSCLEGFTPKFQLQWGSGNWSGGCVRKKELVCGSAEAFWETNEVKLPDTSESWAIRGLSLSECQRKCSMNCTCLAYSILDIAAGSGCLFWSGELLDIRKYDGNGQSLFLKVSSSDPGQLDTSSSSNSTRVILITISSVLFAILIILPILLLVHKRRRLRKKVTTSIDNLNFAIEERKEDMELALFDLTTIVNATDGFSDSNKLGEGGFGPVHKGTLVDGQQIAVKRLSRSSGQGMSEFRTEAVLIAKLQHRNLVKLLGCCIHGDEKMLIYEYMPSRSLDNFIFDEWRRNALNWNKRVEIVEGIARGLLYLHQDSRLRIIHRDLKASNILLDATLTPKISDFGLARMIKEDQEESKTRTVVGTYGYISPEFAVDGMFSTKSDVFSFGVLVLEIVSGERNSGFLHPEHNYNLLGHAWKLWMEDRPMKLLQDPIDEDETMKSRVRRCIHVGLLCVQQRPDDRPSMSSVIQMLSSDTALPQPKQPGFFTERSMPELESSSSSNDRSKSKKTTDDVTVTLLYGR